ncbi:MAG: recombination protein O N-terminal domain-containing protein [Lentisphaeria bacterium]|nr:recombination protein O N-terminal domain-containing protein [Lentisphaeria bacterium]
MISQTSIIIFSKKPYQESDLIVNGITPDYGRISLLLHRGLKIAEKKFPSCDIFQEFDIMFDDRAGNSNIFKPTEFELATDFSSIAENAKNFKFIGKIGSFLMKNVQESLPAPFLYDTLRNVMIQLIIGDETDGKWSLVQCAVAIKMVFLYENGLLPSEGTPEQQEIIENIISSAIEGTLLPELPQQYYTSLNQWLDALFDYHKIQK